MVQAEDTDGRGEALPGATRGVDFGGKGVEGGVFLGGDGAERVPERRFQRNAGAVAVQGEGMFGGTGAHAGTVVQRWV